MGNLDLFRDSFSDSEFEESASSNGFTFWYASDLMRLVGYDSMASFKKAIDKSLTTLNTLDMDVSSNIQQLKEIKDGKTFSDFKLSRFACYLVVLNADNKKPQVAAAQVYFAKLAGAIEDYIKHLKGVERVLIRDEVSEREKSLSGVVHNAGVENFALFQNAGYLGMYNQNLSSLKELKRVPSGKTILDFMGKEELAANLFRVTQTELKIKNEQIFGQKPLENAAKKVGQQVRQSMIDISGIAPEKLAPEEDIKNVKKGLKEAGKEIKQIDGKQKKIKSS